VLGRIGAAQQANFLLTPQWFDLRGRMIDALRDFPDARIALAAALDSDDAPQAAGDDTDPYEHYDIGRLARDGAHPH